MRTRLLLPVGMAFVLGVSSIAGAADIRVPLDDGVAVVFLDRSSAGEAIVSEEGDPFFKTLSRMDLEARLGQSIEGLSREEAVRLVKERFRSAVQEWTPQEIELVSASCRRVAQRAAQLCPGFIPNEWKFLKTDGSEEGGAAYTRGDSVILPVTKLHAVGQLTDPQKLDRLVAHETCHVYGRQHPRVRTRLFTRLGFSFVGPIAIDDKLAPRLLTNPDGPIADAILRLRDSEGQEFDATMVLYAPVDRFDPAIGQGVMRYLRFGFIPVAPSPTGWSQSPNADGSVEPRSVNEVAGFFEQVGRNTMYLIGPDEILAENVAIGLSNPDQQIANPKIPRDLLEIIRRAHEEGEEL